tara:strand:- start:1899 stop:2435 length:537 start_codon:yes stop_codon:yes gene_type:complete
MFISAAYPGRGGHPSTGAEPGTPILVGLPDLRTLYRSPSSAGIVEGSTGGPPTSIHSLSIVQPRTPWAATITLFPEAITGGVVGGGGGGGGGGGTAVGAGGGDGVGTVVDAEGGGGGVGASVTDSELVFSVPSETELTSLSGSSDGSLTASSDEQEIVAKQHETRSALSLYLPFLLII